MNKILIIVLFISSIFCSETIGLVMKKKGKVDYTPYSNSKKIKTLKISEALFNQDLIETGKDGFAKFVYLDDASTIKIHKNSEVYVQGNIKRRKIMKQVNIATGIMKLDINRQQSGEFKIITPTSVASVKGTRFWIDVNGKKGDLFHGLSGIVEITNNATGEKISLTENTTAISLPDGTLNIKKTISKELIDLEILEQDVGEPINDMPQNNLEDDSGYNLPGDNNDSTNGINEIIIKLKNSSSQEKTLIIKYVN